MCWISGLWRLLHIATINSTQKNDDQWGLIILGVVVFCNLFRGDYSHKRIYHKTPKKSRKQASLEALKGAIKILNLLTN